MNYPAADACYKLNIQLTLKLTLVTMHIFLYELPWSWRLLQDEYLINPEADATLKLIVPWSWRYPEADATLKLMLPWSWRYPEADTTLKLMLPWSWRYPEADA